MVQFGIELGAPSHPASRPAAERPDVGRRGMSQFENGDRVELADHFEFENGITGTLALPPDAIVELCPPNEWDGCKRTIHAENGRVVSYYVIFDEPHDDGSGDGPYRGAEINAECIRPLSEQ
jgi:hypothetical protein